MALIKVKVRGQESVGGRRNIIHNGDFKVAQRYASKTGVNSNQYVLDRWQILNNTCHFTVSQSTDVPAGQGFSNSMKLDVTTQQASPSAGDYANITQRFEGKHLQELMKGTSNAKKVTVSFWVKSTLTGTYVLEFDDLDNNRHHPFQYTISSANTWEKKIITFTADTTGAIDNDVNGSMRLTWWLGVGTNYTSGTYSASWQSRQATDVNRAPGQVLFTGSTANDFYITGVQMEIGETNTEFENRPFGEELALCRRYFCKTYNYADAVGSVGSGYWSWTKTTSQRWDIPLYQGHGMRTTPTIVAYNASTGTAGQYRNASNGTDHTVGTFQATQNMLFIDENAGNWNNLGGGSVGRMFVTADAEL
jgi:hypothetical protein